MQNKFSIQAVLDALAKADAYFKEVGDVSMHDIWNVLIEFTKFFKILGGIMSTADSDITQKVFIMRTNYQKCPLEKKPKGFVQFVKWQLSQKLQKHNGDDGAYNVKKYCSTSRTLLRQMWFLTYLYVIFEGLVDDITGKVPRSDSELFKHAYNQAFGQNHSFMLRQAAKLAIMATSDKLAFIKVCLQGKKNQSKEEFLPIGKKFVELLKPSYDHLWNFYKKTELLKLP